MSLAVVLSRGLSGLDAPLVTVEVHLSGGLPAFNLVGLPETEVKESRDHVRAALRNAQFEFPARKNTEQWLYNSIGIGTGAQKPFARFWVHGGTTRRYWLNPTPRRNCQASKADVRACHVASDCGTAEAHPKPAVQRRDRPVAAVDLRAANGSNAAIPAIQVGPLAGGSRPRAV
jgi:hypothetical protein